MATTPDINTEAAKAASISVDGQTLTRRSLGEIVAANRASEADATAQKKNFGIRMGRLRNQGTAPQ